MFTVISGGQMELSIISGLGPKNEKLLNKLNIYSCEDLIENYPYRYNIYNSEDIKETDYPIIVKAVVETDPVVFFIRKNLNRLSFKARVATTFISVTIFNRLFLKRNITRGKVIYLIGKYSKKNSSFVCSDIKFNMEEGKIEGVYHLTNMLTNKAITKFVKESLKVTKAFDKVPLKYKDKYNFIDKDLAIKKIHFPSSVQDIKEAKKRLIYEELFEFSFKMNILNNGATSKRGIPKNIKEAKIKKFIDSLPFSLTDDQQKAVEEILDDLKKDTRGNRLILGDVGSGKTVVATVAMYANFLAGYKSALMAPTEILAMQHYFGIQKLLEPLGIRVDIATGSMTKREKNALYKRVANNEVDILIGTHALLNEEIKFNKLGLVITDEQHRFGVNQRSVLQNKDVMPDVLYLSATPIPRTYAMTIYGDLDISMIKSKPNGRKEIITSLIKESQIKEALYKILEEIKKGHQVYIVSPLVNQNDELDISSVTLLKERITKAYKGLIKTEIIHGKMKQAEKETIMNDFKNNIIKILISTTVIEVGIDVPNATMMVIFNAERFGLATLHQLRGRVGRSELQSYCILISNQDAKRLEVMVESNDGFYISEKDFELRGHGDLFGTRQSGDMAFKLSDLRDNYDILSNARNDVVEYIEDEEYKDNLYYRELYNNVNIVD